MDLVEAVAIVREWEAKKITVFLHLISNILIGDSIAQEENV